MNKKMFFSAVLLCFFLRMSAAENELFPEIPGWKMKVEENVYNSGNLWELINGAADIFLSYYFQDLHIAEYTRKDQIIRVELYRHKTTDDAYGIYTAERMPDYEQVTLGAQGYKSQGIMNFLTGDYYVKVMSAGVEEADEQSLAQVANKVNDGLAKGKSLPGILDLFPKEGMVYLSDTYIAQNFLGFSFFRNAFTVRYDHPSEMQLFIINLTAAEIKEMVDKYVQLMKEENVQQKDGVMIVNDMFNGKVFLKQHEGYLVGVLNTTDEALALSSIQKVLHNIK